MGSKVGRREFRGEEKIDGLGRRDVTGRYKGSGRVSLAVGLRTTSIWSGGLSRRDELQQTAGDAFQPHSYEVGIL